MGFRSSGKMSLAKARAAGADMTLAVRMWLTGACSHTAWLSLISLFASKERGRKRRRRTDRQTDR